MKDSIDISREYYGQSPCLPPEALRAVVQAITDRDDYPEQPRYADDLPLLEAAV